jgi:hypothetical protein
MNFSWPNRAAGKAVRRSAARVAIVGVAAVTVAGAAALAAPAMSAMAATHAAKHATTTKMSAVSGYVGTKLTLAAKVTGSTPKGTVKFIWGHTTLCSATLSNGTARCGHVFGGVGSLRVEALYTGNSTHKASSAVATVKVLAVKTSVKVTASPAAATTGKAVKLTAVLTPTASAGTVTFSVGATKLGSAKVVSGKATLSHTWTTAGARTVTAAYGGNATHAKSSGTTKVTVTAAPAYATTTVFSNLLEGPAVNHTALGVWNWTDQVTVTDNTAGGPAPTGTVSVTAPITITDQNPLVTFYGCGAGAVAAPGKPVTATIQLKAAGVNAEGQAYSTGSCAVSTPTNSYGFVLQQANYTPASSEFVKSGTGNEEWKMINYMPTTTTVTSTAATAGAVALSANVVPQAPIPAANINDDASETGKPTVAFTVSQAGVQIATCTGPLLPLIGGPPPNTATCDVTLAAGTYSVAATYSGDEYSYTSTDTETLTVTAAG